MITMKMKRALSGMRVWQIVMLIFMLSFIAVAPPLAEAQIPRYINYQGKLTDANDDPVTGDMSVTIRIYDAESGGTALWTETQTVSVARGIFSILLGSSATLDSLDFNDPYWYSVEVEADGEMTPRQRLTSVGYAINADKLDGYDADDFIIRGATGGTSLIGDLEITEGSITGGANEDIILDPTGTGNILMKIDSTSGDFKITDGTTNFVLVDNATGDVSLTKNLTVTGNITLDGSIADTSGAVTIADAITQSGSSNQVTFAGNVDANNGLDVTGDLTVSGATTLGGALDMNSNIDLDYSGTSAALNVTQASTGPAAQFSGQRVVVGASEVTNTNATATGELYVQGDMEVDGTIYGNISSSGTTSLGDTTLDSLVVTGTSDLRGNVSNSTGVFTVADNTSIAYTDSSTTGTKTAAIVQPTYQDAGVNSDTVAIGLNVAPVVNYTGAVKSGSYTALKIAATETSLPVGTNYLINATAGADGTTQKFYVDNSGNAMFAGTITAALSPSAPSDVANKAYVDSITPASAGGWTDGGTGIYLTEVTDNVGIGTSTTDTYKLNISGSANVTDLYIGGAQVTATAAELNKLDGYAGTMANLNTLTNGSGADALHSHAASSLTGDIVSSIDGITNDGGDIDFVEGANMVITPNDVANTITFASTASGDEVSTTSLTFGINSDNAGAGVANGTGIVLDGGSGTDASIKFNSATNNIDIAGVTGGLSIPNAATYKINGAQIASADLSDSANLPKLDTAGTITGDWVNTAHPWADNEVANDITASNYLPLAGGTMTGDINLSAAGTNIVTTGIDLDLSPAAGYGVTSSVTKNAATGDEAAYNLAATIDKATSGNYTGIKLNVAETSAPGAADKLLDLQVDDASKFTVDNAGLVTTASVNSASVVNDSLTAEDLNVNVVSSVDGVTNDGGDINLVAGDNVTITPDNDANTITITSSYVDTVLNQEQVEDYAGGMVTGNTETNIDVTYDDAGGKLNFALTGVPVLAPTSTQTITAADTAATPLILKGMGGQTANLLEVQDSAALSHLTVEADGDTQIDTSGLDALGSVVQTNASAALALATNTAKLGGGAGADSDGVLKMGINEGNYQYIWYDTDAGTDGLGAFIFSDQAVIPTASPAYLNFGVNRDAETGRYNQYYAIKLDPDVVNDASYSKQKFSVVSIPNPGADWVKSEKPLFDISSDGSFNIYDPSMGDAVFQIEPGGRLAHDFRNIIKNGSFEAFSGFEKFVGYDPTFSQTGTYNDTTTGYRGGWSNFAPDEWTWVEGKIVQHSPALFQIGTGITGTFNTDFFDGRSAVAMNEWIGKRGLDYVFGVPESGNDTGIKQVMTGLEPNTWYSVGAALMSTNPATTKAILDITGQYVPTTNITSGIGAGDVLNGSSASTISVTSTANFPLGGTILIDSELFDYTGKTDTTFRAVTRSINSTAAATHSVNAVARGVFKPLRSASSSFVENKGSFKTDAVGSDITVYLIAQQAVAATDTDFARFDAVQLVEGKVLPKYSATSITDTGDQSIYGTLKLGRSADGRGGILSVDQYVRTRGIDFFSEDPGMSGTAGGGGSVDRVPYSFINIYSTAAVPKTPGYVKMDVSGNYIENVMRKFQVKVMGTYDSPSPYVKFRYIDCIDPMNEWSETAWPAWTEVWYPTVPIPISINETDMAHGIKIKFSDTTGFKGGDQWEFKAYGMDPGQRVYDSFNKETAYKSSETRIFRDPETGELTFEDSNAGKVKLSEIVSQRSEAYISPPARDPNNMGFVNIAATGELSSVLFSTIQNFEVWSEVQWDTNGNMILPPTKFGWSIMWTPNTTGTTYTWYGNWGQNMNRGSAVSLVSSTGQDTGIDITFPVDGTINQYERWRFLASPSTAANVPVHHHATEVDGGALSAAGTTTSDFVIASASTPDIIKLGFGTSIPQKYIQWNSTLNRFEVSNDMAVTGTLSAASLSGNTSTTGTSSVTFGVNTDIAGTSTEPSHGSGFIINGGTTGNVKMVYDATGNYLNVFGQTGTTDTFTGINIPSGAKYKIGANNLSASDIGAANFTHTHIAQDLPVAANGVAGIIPATGLTNAMVSTAEGAFSRITGVGTLGSLNVNGATSLAITTGNVGIGTAATDAGLDVQKAVTASGGMARGTNLAQILTATANNDVMIGLRIAPTFTNGSYANVENYGLIVASGSVGIGTNAPTAPLDVNGTIASNGLNVSGTTNLAVSTGNVGIGTAVTNAGLDVQKAVTASGAIARGANFAQTLTATANDDVLTGLRIAPAFVNGSNTNVQNYGLIVESGNVGIGTNAPAAALDVNGVIGSKGLNVSSGTVNLPAGQIDNTELANSSITVNAGTGLVTGGSASLGGAVTVNLGTLTGLTAGEDTLAVNYGSVAGTSAQGNVTLTGPTAGNGLTGGGGSIAVGAGGTFSTINVASDATITTASDSIGINLNNPNTWIAKQTFNGEAGFPGSGIWNTAGNVGIGTVDPGAPLDVAKTFNSATAIDYGAIIEPRYNVTTYNATNKYTALLVKAIEQHTEGYGGTKLILDLQAGASPTSRFSVDNAGNVVSNGTINGQTLGATSTLAAVNVTGDMTVGGGYGSTGITMDTTGNLKLDGNIYVKGVMYRENLTDLQIQNNTITLNASDAPMDADAFIGVMASGTKANPGYIGQIKWDSSANKRWEFSNSINLVSGKDFRINGTSVLSATTLGVGVVSSTLQGVGILTTGIWNATPIGVAYGGTNLTSYTTGDMLYASSAGTLAKLPAAAAGSVLISNGAGAAPSYSGSPVLSGALTVQGAGDSSFAGKVGIGVTAPTALLDVYNKPANGSGVATAVVIEPDYSLLNTAGDGYTALKLNVVNAQAGAAGAKNLLDMQVAGVSKAKVDSTGVITSQGLTIGSIPLGSGTAGSEGAKLVGTKTNYTNFTATEATVQGALTGIDTALGTVFGGEGNFTNLVVTGTSDLQGTVFNSTVANNGAVVVADALSQTGAGQVAFSGNIDAAGGVDITGALNLAGGTTYKVTATGDATFKDLNVASVTSTGSIVTTAGSITSATGLTVLANGASITGGLNNNAGGITATGSISGAGSITSTGQIVTSSTIRSLASVGLIPEYANATPSPDGADNFGTMALKYSSSHNYYEWTTSEPTTQDYDIVIRYRLPDGFTSFDEVPIKLWNKVSSDSGNTKVDVSMLGTNGAAIALTGGSSLQNTAWTESIITIDGTPTFAAGGYVTLIIKLTADQGATADVGELTLKGNW